MNNTKELFKKIITEFQQTPFPQLTLRELNIPKPSETKNKAYAFVGMGRSGKTGALYQQMYKAIQENKLQKSQIIYIDFSDDCLDGIKADDLPAILNAYFELYPQYAANNNLHFYFDGIPMVQAWEDFVIQLLDSGKGTVYVAGSSAKMLDQLRGHVIEQEIFPLSFREYLHFKSEARLDLAQNLHNFLYYGGFPEVLTTTESLQRKSLQRNIANVIYRDIIERHSIGNVQAVKKLLIYCLQNSADYLSINKIYNTLKEQGYAVSKNSLYEFMDYFADAYCLFSVDLYHVVAKKTIIKPKKIYLADQGLISAYAVTDENVSRVRLKTAVFNHLRRKTKEIFYYQTQSGTEIDFLTMSSSGTKAIYHIEAKEHDAQALKEAMVDLGIQQGFIITINDEKEVNIPEGMIRYIPIWRFLMLKS